MLLLPVLVSFLRAAAVVVVTIAATVPADGTHRKGSL